MTENQETTLASAFLMLEDAFDHVLIVVRDAEKRGDVLQPQCEASWSGGMSGATYMAHQALKQLDYSRNARRVPAVSKKVIDAVMRKPKGSE